MIPNKLVKISLGTAAAALTASFSFAVPSRADVSVFASQTTGTTQNPPASRSVRLFFRGTHARLEVEGKPVLLYDARVISCTGSTRRRRPTT